MKLKQWSIRSMLLWMLVIGLSIPYLINLLPVGNNPFSKFLLSNEDVLEWVHELDPNAWLSRASGSRQGLSNSISSESEFVIVSAKLSETEIMAHIKKSLIEKIYSRNWTIMSRAAAKNRISTFFSNSNSAYRVYLWHLPLEANDRIAIQPSDSVVRIKLITIGYAKFHGRLRAQPVVESAN